MPAAYGGGEPGWREIAKGRIIDVHPEAGIAMGEIYLGFGGKDKDLLKLAVDQLTEADFLEIDQYGAAAKTLSGLTEYYLVEYLKSRSGLELHDRVTAVMACGTGKTLVAL